MPKSFAKLLGRKRCFTQKIDIFSAAKLRYNYSKFTGSWIVLERRGQNLCDLFKNESFDGNYTLWDNIDHAWCLKARILREQGNLNESKKIIEFVNQYRKPELYKNGVDWFLKTLDINIQSNLEENCKAGAKSWRLLKLELAIAYREAGKYPVLDDELEMIIKELKDLLSKEK